MWAAIAVVGAVGSFAFGPVRPAFAWGDIGHRVVARIAWDNMTPTTRQKVIALLSATPADTDLVALRPKGLSGDDANRAFFEFAATWPDVVKGQKTDAEKTRRAKYSHGNWHYKDVFFEQDPTTGKVTERTDMQGDKENAVESLSRMTKQLADLTADPGDRGIDIAWIEHLTGDLHMPLHNVARITKDAPEGDQGGNKVVLEEQPAPGRQYPVNLHSYWDDMPASAFPAQDGEDLETRLGRIASEATKVLPRSLFEEAGLTELNRFDDWNQEGAEVAQTRVYPSIVDKHMPSDAYAVEAKQTALVGLAKAGYRLAATLEAALADK